MQPDFFSGTLNLEHVRRVVLHLLDEFTIGLKSEWAETQDHRALAVEWLCVFVPEAITDESRQRIQHLVRLEDETTWDIFAPLRAAMFAVTGDESWASPLYSKMTSDARSKRSIAIASLGLVAHLINFRLDGIVGYLLGGIRANYFWSYEAALLLAAWKGNDEDKRQALQQFDKYIVPHLLTHKDDLIEFFRGESRINKFLVHKYAEVTAFIALESMTLGVVRGAKNEPERGDITVADIQNRIIAHPMTGYFVEFEPTNVEDIPF